jgi:hypothetical protein
VNAPKPGNEYCPDCGGKLLYNGQGLVCIRCPYDTTRQESKKDLPAVGNSAEDPD